MRGKYFRVQINMSYAIANPRAIGNLTKDEALQEIQAGFVAWSQVTPFVFRLVEMGPDIDFQVRIGAIDGKSGGSSGITLAHWNNDQREIVIDEKENWANLRKAANTQLTLDPLGLRALLQSIIYGIIRLEQCDLRSVMVHEIGHLLQLKHNAAANSVMHEKLEKGSMTIVNGRPIPAVDISGVALAHSELYSDYYRSIGQKYWWNRESDGLFEAVEIGFDQSIWAVGKNGVVYRVINSMRQDPATGKFASRYPVSDGKVKFRRLAVLNQDAVMGIDTENRVWQLVSEEQREWKAVRAFRESDYIHENDLAFSPTGKLYGVVPQTDGIISWHYSPVENDFNSPYFGGNKTFISVNASKPVVRISVCHHPDTDGKEADEIWALSTDGTIMRWRVGTPRWETIQGALIDISVGSDGTVVGVSSDKTIWHYNRSHDTDPNAKAWKQLNGKLAAISAGDSLSLWGVDGSGKLMSSLPETLQDD